MTFKEIARNLFRRAQIVQRQPSASKLNILQLEDRVVPAYIAAGNLNVIQNDTGNATTSVTVTVAQGTPDFFVAPGSNRGDYNVQIGTSASDDVANGILITSVTQNGRDNGEGTGLTFATSSIDTTGGGYFIPIHSAPAGGEYNINVAAAYFNYNDFIGGWARNSTNGGPITSITGSGNFLLGAPPAELVFQQGLNGYTGVTDGLIHENGTSNFTAATEFLDGPASGSPNIHGLIRFDDIIGNAVGQLPPGTTIHSARLSFRTSTVANAESGGPYNVHQLLVPFDTASNWTTPFGGNGPDQASGEIGPVTGSFTNMGAGARAYADVTAIVQNWLNGQANHGFNINPGTSDGWSIDFSENATQANRPMLEIFLNPPAPANRIIELGGGVFTVEIAGVHSQRDGVLLVNGGKNEDNYALSRANADGTWTVFVKDNGVDGSGYEQDPFAFVYVPNAPVDGSPTEYVSGRLNGNAMPLIANGKFTAREIGGGQYYLEIDGYTPTDGTLIVSPEGGNGVNVDNILTYQASGNGWIIQSRDLPQSPPTLQDVGTEPMLSFIFVPHAPQQVVPQGSLAAAEVIVVQNDGNNNTTSVSVSLGTSTGQIVVGGQTNRADVNLLVGQNPQGNGGGVSNVAGGIFITSPAQNSRDNTAAGGPTGSYGTTGIDIDGTFAGTYFIPTHRAGDPAGGTEFNINFSAAYFSYSDGWIGALVRNSAGTNGGVFNQIASGHPSLVLGTHIIPGNNGTTVIDLRSLGINSQTSGVLMANHAKNGENNTALTRANADGTWTIFVKDGGTDGTAYEQDPIAFVFIPARDGRYVSGKVLGDASIESSTRSGLANVTNPSAGVYRITIAGENPDTGVLVVTPEGGVSSNVDNLISFERDGNGWLVHTRDIPSLVLEAMPAGEPVFSFIFVPKPDVMIDREGNFAFVNQVDGINNSITVSRVGNNLRISDSATMLTASVGMIQIDHNTIEVPISSITGKILVNTLAGDDTLTIVGDIGLEVEYTAGGQATAAGNALRVIGNGLTATVTPSNSTLGHGSISFGTTLINFTSLQDLDYDVGNGTLTLALPNTNNLVTIESGTLIDGATSAAVIRGSSDGVEFATTRIRGSAIILETAANPGTDSITVQGINASANITDLSLTTGQDSSDLITITGNVSVSRSLFFSTSTLLGSAGAELTSGMAGISVTVSQASTLAGNMNSSGAFTKNGSGTLTLAGTNTPGSTSINAGILNVNGTLSGDVDVQAGAQLGGSGMITGNVTSTGAGTVNPGNSPGILTIIGNYSANTTFEINTPYAVAGTDYDQLVVQGASSVIDLSSAAVTWISLGGGVAPALPSVITLIDNQSTNAITPFSNAAQGSIVTLGAGVDARDFILSYSGNDGNDMVLITAQAPTLVYVDDSFSGNFGQFILDADLGTTGNQSALFGINAFTTIAAAQAAVATGGTIIVNGGIYNESITLANTQTLEITGPDAAQSVSISALTTAAGQNVILEGSSTLTVGNDTSTTIAGTISGSGSLVKQGSGTLTLRGANTYTGTTTINGGELQIGGGTSSGTLGTGTVILGGGILRFNRSNNLTVANTITGNGTIIQGIQNSASASGSTLTLSGNNNYTGQTIINAGGITVTNSNALGASGAGNETIVNFNTAIAPGGAGVVLNLQNNITLPESLVFNSLNSDGSRRTSLVNASGTNNVTGSITLIGNDIINFSVLSGTLNLNGGINGSYTGSAFFRGNSTSGIGNINSVVNIGGGNFARTDTALWNLNSTGNTWGATNIFTGELRMGVANALPTTTTVSMGQSGTNNPTFNLNGFSQTIAELRNSPSLSNGTMIVTNTSATPATLTINGSGTNTYGIIGSPTARIEGNLSLVRAGTGTTILAGANTYTGTTTINSGTLSLSGGSAIADAGAVIVNGGTLNLLSSETIGSLTGATGSFVTLNGNSLTTGGNNTSTTYSGVISGTGNLVKNGSGAFTLAGANTYTGTTTINAGTLQLGAGGTTGSIAAGTISNNAALVVNRSNTYVVNNLITGSGTLLQNGSGTTVLTAANTYTGQTTVSAGNLLVNGSITSNVVVNGGTLGGTGTVGTITTNAGGSVNPGVTTGVLTSGSVTFLAGSNFTVEINGLTVGTQYDRLNVNGTVDLTGSTLNLIGTFVPNPLSLQTITIIDNDGTSDAVVGTFAGLAEGSAVIFNGQSFFISYAGGDGNDVVLSSQPLMQGTDLADTFTLTGDGTTFTVTRTNANGTITANYVNPSPALINILGGGGDDVLIVNSTGSSTDPIPTLGVFYDGQTQDFTSRAPNSLGDVLRLLGTASQTATYTPDAAVTGQGMVTTNFGTVSFTGLEPVDLAGFGSVTLNLPGADDVVSIANGFDGTDGTTPALVITGTSGGVAFEQAHVWNVGKLTIDTTGVAGVDSVTVVSADNSHGIANLSIQTGSEAGDVITVNGVVNVSGTTTLDARTINLNANIVNKVTGTTATVVNVDDAPSGQIQDAIDVANPSGATINVASGTYAQNLFVNRGPVALLGAGAASTTITAGAGSLAANFDVLVEVSVKDVTISGFTFDGVNGTHTARHGIITLDTAAVDGLTVSTNTLRNFFGDGVQLINASNAAVTGNTISDVGTGAKTSGFAGVYLEDTSLVTVSGNTITVSTPLPSSTNNSGVLLFGPQNSATVSNNLITVGASTNGVTVEALSGGAVTILGNTINAATGLVSTDSAWGIGLAVINPSASVAVTNNTIGAGGGTFERGIDIFAAQNVAISGGSIANSAIGIAVVEEDFNNAVGNSLVTITNPNITVVDIGLYLEGGATNDTFEVNTAAAGAANRVTWAGNQVDFTGITNLVLDGREGSDTYNVQFAKGPLPDFFLIDDTGTAGTDTANVYGTAGVDNFDINSTRADAVIRGSETVRYTNELEALLVHGPASPGDVNPLSPTAIDLGDTFTVTPDVETAITVHGGNPVNGVGDTLILNLLGATTGINLSNATVPAGSITWSGGQRANVTWSSIETFPIPLGLGGSFDFNGSAASPTQPGFLPVLASDSVTSGAYAFANVGWTTPVFSFDRGTAPLAGAPLTSLLQDGAYNWWTPTNAGVFQVSVAENQPVRITAIVGDTFTGRDFIRMEVSSDNGATWVSLPGSTTSTFTMRNLGFDFVSFTSDLYTPTSATLLVRIYDYAVNGGDTFWVLNSLEVRPEEMVFPLSFARTTTNALEDLLLADGTTIDTYAGTGAAPNAVLEVRVSNGANAGTDVLPQMQGFQVQADALGNFTFQVRRPTGTSNTITLRDVTGNSFGQIVQVYSLPEVRRIDFGTTTSPVQALTPNQTESATAPEYAAVGTQLYNGTSGNALGWVGTAPSGTYDRGTSIGNDLIRDGVFGNQSTPGDLMMDLALANTMYSVTVVLGDLVLARDQMRVSIIDPTSGTVQSVAITSLSTPQGQTTSVTFTAMTDAAGRLRLRFQDLGGNETWALAALEARPLASVATLSIGGGLPSVTADGTTVTTYTITGATPDTLVSLETTLGTFVTADGSARFTGLQVLTDATGNATFQIISPISNVDIVGTITAREVTGASFAVRMQDYTAGASATPSIARFDFNGAGNDTRSGWTGVRGNTVYTSTLGYGWVAPVSEFERSIASTPAVPSLFRDGAWAASGTGTFRISTVAGQSYQVNVYIGDSYAAWQNIRVRAEGGTWVTANTTSDRFGFITVSGSDINFDGFFDIQISTVSGTSIWVVNGLEISPTLPTLSVSGPTTGVADGTTDHVFTITGASPNALLTVTTLGTAQGADASTALPGFQILADAAGNATLTIRSPRSIVGVTDTIVVRDTVGGLRGTITQTYTATDALRFDFNAGANDTASSFVGVRGTTLYSSATGFGWVSGVNEFERTAASVSASNTSLYRDGAWGNNTTGTFQVQGAAFTTYEARVYIGDSLTNWNGIRVSAMNGAPVNATTPTTSFGFVTVTGTTGADGLFRVSINTNPGFATWVANGIDIALVGSLPSLPLTSLPGTPGQGGGTSSDTALSQADLDTLAQEAIRRWTATGLTAEQVQTLTSVKFVVGDLSATGRLGEQRPGVIVIDATANGLGWFVDSTPSDDNEFTLVNGRLVATTGIALSGVDLLTVLMHELGHQLGYADLSATRSPGHLMAETLSTGERRLPTGATITIGQPTASNPALTAPAPSKPSVTPVSPRVAPTPNVSKMANIAWDADDTEVIDLTAAPSHNSDGDSDSNRDDRFTVTLHGTAVR